MSARWRFAGIAVVALFAPSLAQAEVIAITGGTVHTLGPAGTIQGGTVLIEDGKIRAVGRDVAVPAGAKRIDATGKVVTPGLIDSLTRIGLVEVSAVQGSQDATLRDDRITAAFEVTDALNPRSTLIPVNRIEGITRAVVAPNTGNSLIAGRGAIIHLGTESPGYIVRSPAAMFAVLGETGAELSGGSRGGAMLRLREALQDAEDYAANRASFERGERREYALSRLDLEALVPVVRGELPLVVAVREAADVEAALRLKKDFRLKMILADAVEAWKVAPQIAEAKVPVLLNVLSNLPESFESLGANLESAAWLHKAGVTVAFMTGEAHNIRNLKQGAGNAAAYGMPREAALAAMTTVPARIWGLQDRYGSLEAGKDADVVVWDGDPLEVTTFADHVFIRGAEIPMESRQTRLRDRYKNVPGDLPPVYQKP
ncbi:MAG TPA: amidohydrolase family protein [Thermoanaerobaculia bacterium]